MSQMGDILAELRADRGIKQWELAKKIHVSVSSISAFETGVRVPGIDILVKLSVYYDVTTDFLLGISKHNTPPSVINELFVEGTSYGSVIQSLKLLSTNRKKAEVPYDDAIEVVRQDVPGVDERMLFSELLDNIGVAWEKLDHRNRRVLELKYILEKPNEEIARELGIGTNSVRMVLTRARNSLKAILDV